MAQSSSSPRSLILHDGELADVCALIAKLGVEHSEHRGRPEREIEEIAWDLVVATPKRLLELDLALDARPTRIAILEKDSRTLSSMLERAAIELIVRRPVHPEALRLLILHSLYRGPEKRVARRVSIGAPVRIRTGLRRRSAILADLSVSSCRLLCDEPIPEGRRVRVTVPAEIACGKSLSLSGRVVRNDRGATGVTCAVEFSAVPRKVAARLKATISAHTVGPAVYEGVASDPPAPPTAAVATGGAADGPALAPAVAASSSVDGDERRTSPRHDFPKQVAALGLEAARILIGRDISLGGMRVEADSDVSLGDDLHIALHLRAREEPIVVQARVERDDGEDGLLLKFRDLPASAEDQIRRMIDFLPILAVREEGEEGAGIIVSEILEVKSEDD